MKKNVFRALITTVAFLGALTSAATAGAGENITRAYDLADYSRATFAEFTKTTELVGLSDGTRLAVDIFLPSAYSGSGTAPGAFPTILVYTPYSRAFIDPATGEITDLSTDALTQTILSYGYAAVVADMRGCGASFGSMVDFFPQFGLDGRELVDWIAAQSWSNGKVGMIGGSYYGWSQLAIAAEAPEALKCIVPWVVFMEGFSGILNPGGIPSYSFRKVWSGSQWAGLRNMNIPGLSQPSAPAVDEDGDGELADEIPLDLDGSGTFVDDYDLESGPWPPQYPDTAAGAIRTEHYYYFATKAHFADVDIESWADNLEYIDQEAPLPGLTTRDVSSRLIPKVMDSKIPVFNVGGWFDGFARSSTELFATMRGTNTSKLLMQPTYHAGVSEGFKELLGVNETLNDLVVGLEMLKWFDRWLKDAANGVENEPPVLLYVMNGPGWRAENEWPLDRQVWTDFLFNSGGTLNPDENVDRAEGADDYQADFTHNSGYGEVDVSWLGQIGKQTVSETFYKNRYLAVTGSANNPTGLPIRTELDKQCLTYTSEALDKALEVTGHPEVRVFVSSTADYGDFYFYLEDVDENGRAVLVTETLLRAEFAGLVDNNEEIGAQYGVDVLPDLFWHGFSAADYVDRIFDGGSRVVELAADFQPTSWVFKAGHGIRVSIACADWPTFKLHPQLAPNNLPDDPANIIPTITVYRDAEHPSGLRLPVIPASGSTTSAGSGGGDGRSAACFIGVL
ncbi:MAG: CocE/NonD family hydrolase [Pseudomonadota bacterium]